MNQVETALYNAYGTRQVTQIYAPNNQYQVILQVAPEFQKDPSALRPAVRALQQRTPRTARIPWRRSSPARGPLAVSHTGQLPSVTLSFNLKQGVALGDAVAMPCKPSRRPPCPRPSATRFQGTAQAFQDSLQGLGRHPR